MNNTDIFTGLAQKYDASRPSYANDFIDCLYEKYGFQKSSNIAVIGFGTGVKTPTLLLQQ